MVRYPHHTVFISVVLIFEYGFYICRRWNDGCFYCRIRATDSRWSLEVASCCPRSENDVSYIQPPQDLLKHEHLFYFKPSSLCFIQQRTTTLIKLYFVWRSFAEVFFILQCPVVGFLEHLGEEHMETSWFSENGFCTCECFDNYCSLSLSLSLALLSEDGLCYPHLYSVFTYFPSFLLPVFETAPMRT